MPEEYTLTDDKFKEFVRHHGKRIIDTLSGESLTPELMVMTHSPTGEDELTMCMLAVPFNEAHEKHSVLFNIGKRFYEDQKVTLAVVLSSEAWTSQRAMDDKSPRVEPRHDPNRKENIIIVGSGLQEHQRLLICTPIRRDDKNEMLVDGESKEIETARFPLLEWFWRGYFSTLLPR